MRLDHFWPPRKRQIAYQQRLLASLSGEERELLETLLARLNVENAG